MNIDLSQNLFVIGDLNNDILNNNSNHRFIEVDL